jgi:hypothetical protein
MKTTPRMCASGLFSKVFVSYLLVPVFCVSKFVSYVRTTYYALLPTGLSCLQNLFLFLMYVVRTTHYYRPVFSVERARAWEPSGRRGHGLKGYLRG